MLSCRSNKPVGSCRLTYRFLRLPYLARGSRLKTSIAGMRRPASVQQVPVTFFFCKNHTVENGPQR